MIRAWVDQGKRVLTRSVAYRFKTHSGMLLQSRTLEVPVADNREGKDETGRHQTPVGAIPEESVSQETVTAARRVWR